MFTHFCCCWFCSLCITQQQLKPTFNACVDVCDYTWFWSPFNNITFWGYLCCRNTIIMLLKEKDCRKKNVILMWTFMLEWNKRKCVSGGCFVKGLKRNWWEIDWNRWKTEETNFLAASTRFEPTWTTFWPNIHTESTSNQKAYPLTLVLSTTSKPSFDWWNLLCMNPKTHLIQFTHSHFRLYLIDSVTDMKCRKKEEKEMLSLWFSLHWTK